MFAPLGTRTAEPGDNRVFVLHTQFRRHGRVSICIREHKYFIFSPSLLGSAGSPFGDRDLRPKILQRYFIPADFFTSRYIMHRPRELSFYLSSLIYFLLSLSRLLPNELFFHFLSLFHRVLFAAAALSTRVDLERVKKK